MNVSGDCTTALIRFRLPPCIMPRHSGPNWSASMCRGATRANHLRDVTTRASIALNPASSSFCSAVCSGTARPCRALAALAARAARDCCGAMVISLSARRLAQPELAGTVLPVQVWLVLGQPLGVGDGLRVLDVEPGGLRLLGLELAVAEGAVLLPGGQLVPAHVEQHLRL